MNESGGIMIKLLTSVSTLGLLIVFMFTGQFAFSQENRARTSVDNFFAAIQNQNNGLAASNLREILEILNQNPVQDGENYYSKPSVKVIMLGLKAGIGGYTENGYAAQRAGGQILAVQNSPLHQRTQGLIEGQVLSHFDTFGNVRMIEYFDSEYIGHNDIDRFISRVKLTN